MNKRINFLLAITAILFGGACVHGNDWITVGDGDWATGSNWSESAVPNASGAAANFAGVNLTTAATVALGDGATQTVGSLQFGFSGASNSWTVSGGTLAIDNGANNGAITVNTGSTATISSALNATGVIDLSGGGTLQVSNASGAKGWNITGATLEDTAATPGKLGTGTITLNAGAVLKSTGNKEVGGIRRSYSNPIVINGECTLFSQGLSFSGTMSGSGIIHKRGGWDMTISGNNSDLSADWYLEADYARFNNANAGGTGAVHYKGGALLGYSNGTISNDLYIDTSVGNYLVGGVSEITLTGKIFGSSSITLLSNQYQSANIVNLRGDGSAYTGNWKIDETYSNNKYAPITVSTDNSSNVKVNGGDSRFGQGNVTIGRGVLQAAAAKTYVHNPITLSGDQSVPQLSFEGKVLTLIGGLTGDSDITLNYTTTASSTANRLRLLDSDNSAFSGDWHLKNVLLVTNAGNVQNKAFGSGTIYLEGGSGIVGWSSQSTVTTHDATRADSYVYNNIVASGVNFFRSDGDTIDGTTTSPNYQLTLNGNISGSGLLVREGGGYKFSPRGNNTQYSGDWMIRSDYVETDNTKASAGNDTATHTDLRFGSGTIYITDNAGIQGGTGKAVIADITVNSGKTGNFRNGNLEFYGTVTADGTFQSGNIANFYGTVQGRGTVAAAAIMKDGSIIAPGIENVFQYNDSYNKSAVTDQEVGTLTFSKGLTLETGSVLDIDVASKTSFDKIVLSGTSTDLDLSKATININLLDSFDMAGMNFDDIMTLDYVNATTGTAPAEIKLNYDEEKLFSEAFYGATLVATASAANPGEISLRVSYDQNLVPEPATWTLLLIGLGAGFVQLRRRKK